MPRVARRKSKTGVYHIVWRGANRQEIFHENEDWATFLAILKKYKRKWGLTVYAWCLMNNHVHLLLKEGHEDISNTMKRIGVSYVLYYNWKYRTTGHLFQDRFSSEAVESRPYFLTVVRYIHQNPLKAGMVSKIENWKWSSCCGYYGKPAFPQNLLDAHLLLNMFSPKLPQAIDQFREFNEKSNQDQCLDIVDPKRRLTDEEAKQEILNRLGTIEIAHVKSLPKEKRDAVLRNVKDIQGLSMRQAARILGVSLTLVFKA